MGADTATRRTARHPRPHGIAAEVKTGDTVVALDTTTDAVGLSAAGAGLVIYEMTAQHFDLEEFFLELTTSTGSPR